MLDDIFILLVYLTFVCQYFSPQIIGIGTLVSILCVMSVFILNESLEYKKSGSKNCKNLVI